MKNFISSVRKLKPFPAKNLSRSFYIPPRDSPLLVTVRGSLGFGKKFKHIK